jgi:hypothetical protein
VITIHQSDDDFNIQDNDAGDSSSVRLRFGPAETTLGELISAGYCIEVYGRKSQLRNKRQFSVTLTRDREHYKIGSISPANIGKILTDRWSMPVQIYHLLSNVAQYVKWSNGWSITERCVAGRASEQSEYQPRDPWAGIQSKYPPIVIRQKVHLFGNMKPVDWLRTELEDINRAA